MTPALFKALRARLGLTQAELAEKLGVERNTVNRWEMGLLPIQKITELAVKYLELDLKKSKRDRKI
jgi:DNA-binding XRE family transcriptional regulator